MELVTDAVAGELAPGGPLPTIVIEPAARWPGLNVRELWANRELLVFLVWRDIKVQYAQTVLGAAWAVVQPVMTMLIFTLVFGRLAKIPSDGVPYSVFTLAALIPWMYFSNAFSAASASLVNSSNLITKVYFPRLIIPIVSILSGLVNFAVSCVVLAIMMLWYRVTPSWVALPMIPALLLLMILTATGVGCWLAAVYIQYRDVRQIVPFIVQIWMYISPVVYPLSLVPERYRTLYALNPMAGIIQTFRVVLLRTGQIPWGTLGVSTIVGMALFLSGTLYYRKTEHLFADVA
ncbi:MAG: ABC transporter permease [Chthoniobacterales bacterium]|nr:ABC transporter permease [Gemmatimonadaceae bacterium]MBA3831416.1 ABC transporter permease [Chthoniobacterales bacterium]